MRAGPGHHAASGDDGQTVDRRHQRLRAGRRPGVGACAVRCAWRLATAKLGLPEAKIGVFPANGGTQRLPRLVGRGRALEMMLTGAPIDAQEAWRIGLVNRVVEPAGLLAAARELMLAILANSAASIACILRCVDTGLESGLDAGL